MVSKPHSDAGGSPTAATPAPISVVSPISANSIPSPVEVPSSDSLATIRDRYQPTGFSKEVVDILVASWGTANQKRYCPGGHGYAGVLNGVPVPFQLL